MRKITTEEHNELCGYLEEILSIYHGLQKKFTGNKSRKEYIKCEQYYDLACDTLSELIVNDAIEAGL